MSMCDQQGESCMEELSRSASKLHRRVVFTRGKILCQRLNGWMKRQQKTKSSNYGGSKDIGTR
eukprot:685773-Pleurochrysis_carterae.AAC.2